MSVGFFEYAVIGTLALVFFVLAFCALLRRSGGGGSSGGRGGSGSSEFVICGPTGAGKTVLHQRVSSVPASIHLSVQCHCMRFR